MKYIVAREGRLIRIAVPEGATDENLDGESLYDQLEPILYESGQPPFVLLHDLRRTPRSPIRRKRFTDWVRAHDALIRTRLEAYACVAGSPFLKGMITAVLWVIEPPIAWKAFSDPDEAEAWRRGRLE